MAGCWRVSKGSFNAPWVGTWCEWKETAAASSDAPLPHTNVIEFEDIKCVFWSFTGVGCFRSSAMYCDYYGRFSLWEVPFFPGPCETWFVADGLIGSIPVVSISLGTLVRKNWSLIDLIEGSLETKFPTLWTDEKHSQEEAEPGRNSDV